MKQYFNDLKRRGKNNNERREIFKKEMVNLFLEIKKSPKNGDKILEKSLAGEFILDLVKKIKSNKKISVNSNRLELLGGAEGKRNFDQLSYGERLYWQQQRRQQERALLARQQNQEEQKLGILPAIRASVDVAVDMMDTTILTLFVILVIISFITFGIQATLNSPELLCHGVLGDDTCEVTIFLIQIISRNLDRVQFFFDLINI